MGEEFILPYVPWFIAGGMTLGLVSVVSWVFVTWLQIKHGYPLETSEGKPLEPKATAETAERFKLIASENAQLRAELASMKDRLATVERIVTDDTHHITQEIESLRAPRN
jgi:hypothetical protein